jgi:NADH dehydrogenase/NADH:ubiquinone oxidoreductase subunit G
MEKLITNLYNGREYKVEPNQTIIAGGGQTGVSIFRVCCYHPKLSIEGACQSVLSR